MTHSAHVHPKTPTPKPPISLQQPFSSAQELRRCFVRQNKTISQSVVCQLVESLVFTPNDCDCMCVCRLCGFGHQLFARNANRLRYIQVYRIRESVEFEQQLNAHRICLGFARTRMQDMVLTYTTTEIMEWHNRSIVAGEWWVQANWVCVWKVECGLLGFQLASIGWTKKRTANILHVERGAW